MIQERPRESLVLFDNPIEVTTSPYHLTTYRSPPESQLAILSPDRSVVSLFVYRQFIGAQKKKSNLPAMESKPKQEDILNAILPPREWIEEGKQYI
jgi:hypothetical protein